MNHTFLNKQSGSHTQFIQGLARHAEVFELLCQALFFFSQIMSYYQVCLKHTEASQLPTLFPVFLGARGSLQGVWYHFQSRLVFILLRSKDTKVSSLKNRAVPALSPLGMPCWSSELWRGPPGAAVKQLTCSLYYRFTFLSFTWLGESVNSNELFVRGPSRVWGATSIGWPTSQSTL